MDERVPLADPETEVVFGHTDEWQLDELYHEWSKISKYNLDALGLSITRWKSNANLVRNSAYSFGAYEGVERIYLPDPVQPEMSVSQALRERRSTRVFKDEHVEIGALATLLGLACGHRVPTREGVTASGRRTYPSGGALYPLDVYIAGRSVGGLPAGLYYYHPLEHALIVLSMGAERSEAAASAILAGEAGRQAAFHILIGASFLRSRVKYHSRAYRFVLLEAGHLSQNLSLLAVALRLGMVSVGGFFDDEVNDLLGLNGVDEAIIYTHALGIPSD